MSCPLACPPANVNLLHALVIAPLLLYVGYQLRAGKPVPKTVATVLMAMAVGALAYHAYRAYQKMQVQK